MGIYKLRSTPKARLVYHGLTFLLLFLLHVAPLQAQNRETSKNHEIQELESKIQQGDFESLVALVSYFDHKEEIHVVYGNVHVRSSGAIMAQRIVNRNAYFLDSEIKLDSTTTAQQFRDFLLQNKDKIVYSDFVRAFVLTPFDKRKTDFEVLELTETKRNTLEAKRKELLKTKRLKSTPIVQLIKEENPESLLYLSSLLLKTKYNYADTDELVDLLRLLTHTTIAVPNKEGRLTYYIEEELDDSSSLNLFVYFATHFQDYQWNKEKKHFENRQVSSKQPTIEDEWFDQLASTDSNTAIQAFINLSQVEPQKMDPLLEQYRPVLTSIYVNDTIPLFPYSFLKQMNQLTDYANQNSIDLKGSKKLHADLQQLQAELTFKERRMLENRLIDELTLENITAFEYWCLIYQRSRQLSYSTGRILDCFYSKNWQELLQNPLYLETYLLKSTLYKQLGIVGYCTNYLVKFTGNPNQTTVYLASLSTDYPLVQKQIQQALKQCDLPVQYTASTREWEGNYHLEAIDFTPSLDSMKRNIKDRDSYEFQKSIIHLLSKVTYNQLGEVLPALQSIPISPDILYSFMNRDFGFSFIGDFKHAKVRKEFLKQYNTLDEYQLYYHYLMQAAVDFTQPSGSLDFDKIYTILKYDTTNAFVGGSGTKDNSVYAIIKLLELHFQTSLGYPTKLCMSDQMYACSARKRAVSWMSYLASHHYLQTKHNEPVSFAYSKDT